MVLRDTPLSGRQLRRALLDCIQYADAEKSLEELSGRVGLRRLVRPAMSFIGSEDVESRNSAIDALGWIVSTLAEEDLEAARDIVRRLIWMLTEECGGIGWGAPESIGAILARHETLANEFAHMLISFSNSKHCSYLDHEPLQCDVLRGLRRIARVRPELLLEKGINGALRSHLTSSDSGIAALANEIAELLQAGTAATAQ